jgi:hypothetical protein
MKTLVFALLAVSFVVSAPPVGAQSEYASFGNIPFGSTSAEVQKAMGDKGYEYEGPGRFGDDTFTGKIGAYTSDIHGYYDDAAKLEKWTVNLETPDEDVLAEFESVVKDFTARFGLPIKATRAETDPFSIGDGKVAEAVKAKKATFFAFWNQKGDKENVVDIEITEDATVLISYEGPGWSAYVDRRDAKRKSDL